MATLKDVAKASGLTVGTVSRVLNNRGYISDKTREKVYRVMKELNYQPNEMARSLSKQKNNTIGVILPQIEHPYFAKVLSRLEREAAKQGYRIMLFVSRNKEKREEQLQAFEDFVGSDGILYATEDGVITEVSYEAGDRLTTTGALFSYATSDDMRISVDVTQEDIVDLQVGDAVDITFTAYPEDSYTGSILSINTTATSDYSNTVSYTVEISVEGELEQLYGGMTADVIFVTEEKEDVLYVSRKAIVEENGKTYVYRKTALGGRELAEVETGITNGVDIEILSGLEEGDTIYLASKVSSEAEVKSTEETADSGSGSDTAVGSDTEFEMSEDMQMPGGGDMPQGGPGGGDSGSFGGGMPRGPGGQ